MLLSLFNISFNLLLYAVRRVDKNRAREFPRELSGDFCSSHAVFFSDVSGSLEVKPTTRSWVVPLLQYFSRQSTREGKRETFEKEL